MSHAAEAALRGRVCLVTGANSGIGKATAMALAAMGASVVMACRDERKGRAAQEEISAAAANARVELMLVDLGSQAWIRAFAAAFRERHQRLHVLVNNAGI